MGAGYICELVVVVFVIQVLASGIFMTLVVGGGIMPLIQEAMANSPKIGVINSYWLVIAMLAYILYYALIGCKNVNKDIPVE